MRAWMSLAPLALVAAALLTSPADAQPPRWSIDVRFLDFGVKYYPGEAGELAFQIVNTHCPRRVEAPKSYLFDDEYLSAIKPIVDRADLLKRSGWIAGYELTYSDLRGLEGGTKLLADWNLTVWGYCDGGEPVELVSAAVWFAWPGIGRSMMSESEVGVKLEAFDPLRYLETGYHNGSWTIVSVNFSFPPDVPPEQLSTQPTLELRIRYPSGNAYTYSYPLGGASETPYRHGLRYGSFKLEPERTFTLKILDHSGDTLLRGANVTIQALVHYYYKRILEAPEGYVLVERLPDRFTYRLLVSYNTSYMGQLVVARATSTAYELARSRSLRAALYDVEMRPIDVHGRPLEGAFVRLVAVADGARRPIVGRPVAIEAINGSALFELLPTGNYSISVEWMGFDVYSSYEWIGTHPTLGKRIPRSLDLRSRVGDLLVEIVDAQLAPIPANVTVEGPGIGRLVLAAPDGKASVRQLPLDAEYLVSAINESPFGEARAYSRAHPGELRLELPVYRVSVSVYSLDGERLAGSLVSLGPASVEADARGIATFLGVPAGEYGMSVRWRGVVVHESRLALPPASVEINASVRDLYIRILDAEGEELVSDWEISTPLGRYNGTGSAIRMRLMPDGEYMLKVTFMGELVLDESWGSILEVEGGVRARVGRIAIRARYADGEPIAGSLLVLKSGELSLKYTTNREGIVETSRIPLASYGYALYYGSSSLVLAAGKVHGRYAEIIVPRIPTSVSIYDALGNPLEARLEVIGEGGATLFSGIVDGAKEIILPQGEYLFRAKASGRSAQKYSAAGGDVEIMLPVVSVAGSVIAIEEAYVYAAILAGLSSALAVMLARRAKSLGLASQGYIHRDE